MYLKFRGLRKKSNSIIRVTFLVNVINFEVLEKQEEDTGHGLDYDLLELIFCFHHYLLELFFIFIS